MKNKQTTGILILIFVMIVWGSSFAVTKSVVNTMPAICLAFIRFFVASLCLLPAYILSFVKNPKARLSLPDYGWLFLMGLSGVTFYYISFNYALRYTSASTGALIQGFIPIGIALLGVIFLKEKLSRSHLLGIVLSFIGVVMVGLLSDDQDGQAGSLKGNLFMVASVFCWSFYTIISRKLKHINPLTVTCLSGFAGTLCLFPPAIYEFNRHSNEIQVGFNGWIAIVYLGAISSALCYFLYNKALEKLPAAKVGNFLNLDPLIGVVIAIIFLHESINAFQIAGGLLILSGLFLSSRTTTEVVPEKTP